MNKVCSTGIIDIHGKCVEKISGVPNILLPLVAEARKYKTPEEFSHAFSIDIMHGRYWHITKDADFTIKATAPRDMSTMASGIGGVVGLMVSCDPEIWHEGYAGTRGFIAEIDLSHAMPDKDFHVVNRGFGHEIFVTNLKAASVKRVYPVKEGLVEQRRYFRTLQHTLNCEEDSHAFWAKANRV